ncbi:redoxin domain-containing protein [Pedobacter sp. N23S346]|uniref:redoxin domain-containing protein n=1 Tax=Pedobacter sp. N23S346 TaxID=3402750 RepID=UPI003ACF5CCB
MKNSKSQRKDSFFIALSIVILYTALSGFISSGYVIEGEIKATDGAKLFLSYRYGGKDIVDSGVIRGNRISLTGILPEAVICTLSNTLNQQIKIIIAQNERIKINGTIDQFYTLKIDGASENMLFQSFKDQSLNISGDYRKELKAIGGDIHNKMSVPYLKFRTRVDSLTTEFVKAHPNATSSSLAIIDSYMNNTDADKAATCYNLLSNAGKNTVYGKRIKQFIGTSSVIAPGNEAPDFKLSDLDGKAKKLSDYRGKYVFIDFWASWCPPCRAEHPMLRKLYKEYNQKITFISLSMDASDQSWRKAVTADQLTWTQLNDPLSTNGEVADSYGVKAIPFNCVIDPDGKILATKLRGKDLENFIAQLFKQ